MSGVIFRRLLLGHEVDYRVEVSSHPTTWSPLVNTVPTTKPDADGSVTAVIVDPDGAATDSARFYRIKILASPHVRSSGIVDGRSSRTPTARG